MRIIIDNLAFSESCFKYKDGSGWKATTLIQIVKEQKLKPFDLHLNSIDIGVMPFSIIDLYDFLTHFERVRKTSLKYPVILDNTGYIIDGWHRIAKAIIIGLDTVKAYRFHINPPFDFTGKE